MTLHESQVLLHAIATHAEPVERAIQALGIDAHTIAATFVGDARLTAMARLGLYADAYFFRIRDVLAEQFPALVALVGNDAFHDLIVDYLAACPPRDPSIGRVGERLPAFLAQHPLGARHPEAATIARRTWAEIEVFDGPDADALTLAELARRAPEEFATLPLVPIPCLRVLVGEDGATLVWRRDCEVLGRSASALEAGALAFLAAETRTFGALCEWLALSHEPAAAAQSACELVARWASDALLARPDPAGLRPAQKKR